MDENMQMTYTWDLILVTKFEILSIVVKIKQWIKKNIFYKRREGETYGDKYLAHP